MALALRFGVIFDPTKSAEKNEKKRVLAKIFWPTVEKAHPTVEKAHPTVEKAHPTVEKAHPTVEKAQ